jgi:hypothetical protein
MQITRIRLSDKSSRLHPRHVVPKPAQAYEPADSDDLARVYRFDLAQDSEMISPTISI